MSESFVWGMRAGHVAITQDYKSSYTLATLECRAEHPEETCQTSCQYERK